MSLGRSMVDFLMGWKIPSCSGYQAPSYKPIFTLLAWFLAYLARVSGLFIFGWLLVVQANSKMISMLEWAVHIPNIGNIVSYQEYQGQGPRFKVTCFQMSSYYPWTVCIAYFVVTAEIIWTPGAPQELQGQGHSLKIKEHRIKKSCQCTPTGHE